MYINFIIFIWLLAYRVLSITNWLSTDIPFLQSAIENAWRCTFTLLIYLN